MKSLYRIAQEIGHTSAARTKPDELSYSVIKSGKTSAAMFSLGHKLMSRMHWMIGDRIDVMFDPQMAEGQLIRCKEGGWALSGKPETSVVRFRIGMKPEFGLPETEGKIDLAIGLTDNTIAFAFPTKYRKQITTIAKP